MSVPALSDTDLVAGCRAGERQAWNLSVERFARYVDAIVTQAPRAASLRRGDPPVDRPSGRRWPRDLESVLEQEGCEPHRGLVDLVRERLAGL